MKKVLIIGAGLAGLTCAIKLAELGIKSILISPFTSERSQSVMAAGGINASLGDDDKNEDSVLDVLKSFNNIDMSSVKSIVKNTNMC